MRLRMRRETGSTAARSASTVAAQRHQRRIRDLAEHPQWTIRPHSLLPINLTEHAATVRVAVPHRTPPFLITRESANLPIRQPFSTSLLERRSLLHPGFAG